MNVFYDLQIAENFKGSEFRCFGDEQGLPCCCHGSVSADGRLVKILQSVRVDVWQRPLIVLSGFRCDLYNSYIGGWEHSMHRHGGAADVRVSELIGSGSSSLQDYKDLAGQILEIMDFQSGEDTIGRCIVYPLRGFIHTDLSIVSDPEARIKENWSSPRSRRGF